jgi:hypothetical protein
MSSKPGMERRQSSRLQRKNSAAPYTKGGSSGGESSTGLTKYMGDTKLDWDEGSADASRSMSFAQRTASRFSRAKKPAEPPLPKNWKKVKEKDGSTYYVNSVTGMRSHEAPPPLAAGWKEAMHKDSGRVYYYNKKTKETTFEFPGVGTGGDDDDTDMDEASDPPPAPEGFFGRTVSKFRGKKADGGMGRTATMTKKAKAKEGASDAPPPAAQKTVFISCSTLIKEVKLCVGPEHLPALDALYEKLTSQQIPAEMAVKQLMELVGSTIVQQAGLSVMNSQKGVLPHGWLEYTDEGSGRPYYYNVHTKVTTWYKPTGAVPPPPPHVTEAANEAGDGISMDCSMEMSGQVMAGFI